MPGCLRPVGRVPVTFACDGGATVIPIDPPPGCYGILELVVLDRPGWLLAEDNHGELFRSTNAGCSYSKLQQPASRDVLQLVKGARGVAYGFSNYGVALIEGAVVTWRNRPGRGRLIKRLGADPVEPRHIRVSDDLGQLWDSQDAGEHWTTVGKPPVERVTFPPSPSTTFDPRDLDHVLATARIHGTWMTWDGGRTWASVPIPDERFSFAFSPVDGRVVWASGHTGILLSKDGGETFRVVLTPTQMGDTGGGLVPDPTDPNVVYIMVRGALLRFDLARNTFDRRPSKAWTVFAPSLANPEL